MKLLMRLREAAAVIILLGLVSCGTAPDFENRYAADAGDILRAETYAAETDAPSSAPETDPAVTEQKSMPVTEEPDAVVVLPVAETKPETLPSAAETEPETLPPITETEPETLPSTADTEPETLLSTADTEPETLPPIAETEPETLSPIAETEPETLLLIAETESETLPPIAETEPETLSLAAAPEAIPAGVTFVCNTNSGKYHLPDCGSVGKIKAENIAYLTCAESEIPSGYAPCSVCLAASAAVQKAQIPEADGTVSYILNTNTMKFHSPICKSVQKIKAENYAEFTGSREEAIASGYSPCGNCKP